MQQGDVKLFQTVDDGDISVVNGVIEMSGGLETAAYLSLFGGNEDDNGSDGNPSNWWANLDEEDSARVYRSETQSILQSLPATSNNLIRVQDAATRDLSWFLTSNVASSVDAVASIPALNTVKLVITIKAEGEESSFSFTENWKATT